MEGGWGVEDFGEAARDTHTFARRVGRLPEQRQGDATDYRSLLHRDGSVLSALTLQARAAFARCWAAISHVLLLFASAQSRRSRRKRSYFGSCLH